MSTLNFDSSNAIGELVPRYQNNLIYEQALQQAAVLDEGVIKIKKKSGVRGRVNLKAGAYSSTGWLADGGNLNAAGQVQPAALDYYPKILFSRGTLGRLALDNVSSYEDGVDLIMEEMKSMGEDAGQQLGHTVLTGGRVTTIASEPAPGATSLVLDSVSGLRVGQAFDIRDTDGTLEDAGVTISDIDYDTNTITCSATTNADINDVIWQSGAYDYAILGLRDVCADSSLYGQANTAYEWDGNRDSTTTSLSLSAMKALSTKVKRRGAGKWTHIICNSVNEDRYNDLVNGGRRFMNGSMDAVGSKHEFQGKPIFVDENCPDEDLFFHNDQTVFLHEFKKFSADTDGGGGKKLSKSAVIISTDKFAFEFQASGYYELCAKKRSGHGHMSALAG